MQQQTYQFAMISEQFLNKNTNIGSNHKHICSLNHTQQNSEVYLILKKILIILWNVLVNKKVNALKR